MRYALKFAYDGHAFDGYARQPDGDTVEDAIIGAMLAQGIMGKDGRGNFQSASRTDRGVSAAGNVIAISTDFRKDVILKALNVKLDGIYFHGIADVSEDFNPRYAKSRSYRYIILKSQCPEAASMKKAADIFMGEHDFRHFSKKDTGDENTVLRIDEIMFTESGDFVFIDIKAHRFLWQLVRRLISFILAMANDEIEENKVKEMLSGSALVLASPKPMPPENLILMGVEYDFRFEKSEGSRPPFENMKNEALLRSEVMDQISKIV